MGGLARIVPLLFLTLAFPAAVSAEEPLPNLLGWTSPDDIEPDAATAVWVGVENFPNDPDETGNAGPFDVELYIDGVLHASSRVEGLAAYDGYETSLADYTGAAGEHNFTVLVDPKDEVVESDETDNDFTYIVTFSHERPDVALEILRTRASGWPSSTIETDVRVCNVGDLEAPAVVVDGYSYRGLVALRDGNWEYDALALGAVGPGACKEGTLSVSSQSGTGQRTISLWAGAGSMVWERSYENNGDETSILLGPTLPTSGLPGLG